METYQTRLDRIKKAVKKEELPDKVPALFMLNGWIIEYYGESLMDYYHQTKPEITPEVYKKGIEEFGFDGSFNLNNVASFKSTAALGGGMYAVSEKGIQVSNIATHMIMSEDEYPILIDDFIGYLRDYVMPRRFKNLDGNTEGAFNALMTAQKEKVEFFGKAAKGWQEIEKNGCPIMWNSGALGHPIDFLLDYLRDFKGITLDMRRRPEMVMEAMAVIQDYLMKNVHANFKSNPDCKGPFWPTHLGCFLKPKDFEKFYFPYFNETLKYCIENEIYGAIVLEGNWEKYYDIMQDIPDNNVLIGSMEYGDYKLFKEKMGKKFSLCGGIPLVMLAKSSKEECIDYTKKLIDDCAPGGGFMICTDKAMLNLSDVNPENFKAMLDTVNTYGRY